LADPNAALLALLIGLLFIYCECLRPGMVIPGILGGVAAVVAGLAFWSNRSSWSSLSPAMLALSAAFVLLTVFLLYAALRARRNKVSDA
jgi:membrane-bound ClpP family serine protease